MNIKTQAARVNSVEKSQAFILDIYNSVLNALQSLNERTDKLEKKGAEIMKTTDRLTTQTNSMGQSMYQVNCAIDEMQHYSQNILKKQLNWIIDSPLLDKNVVTTNKKMVI